MAEPDNKILASVPDCLWGKRVVPIMDQTVLEPEPKI